MSTPLTYEESFRGFVYMAFEIILLPVLLQALNKFCGNFFSQAELNFLFFLLNFLAVHVIFHSFLRKSVKKLQQHPIYAMQAVILGLAAYYACNWVFDLLISWFRPGFLNLNNESIASMARESRFLMAVGTVILVPPVEECFCRGLIFRNLYGKNSYLAYIVSMMVFSAIHVLGYVGRLSFLDLLICTVQYLPAGLCLAWTYKKADTIYAPIVMHALVNFWGIYSTR